MISLEPYLGGTDVSRETSQRLNHFVQIVEKWNRTVNLISATSVTDIWLRHVADSAQLFRLRPTCAQRWVDLGSGGGFPALVIAILAKDRAPNLAMTLVESDHRKAAFLREASRQLQLTTTVLTERVENLPHLHADIVSARALAPLSALCEMAHQHLLPQGTAIFPKGRSYPIELAEARKLWSFNCSISPSLTDDGAAILTLTSLQKA